MALMGVKERRMYHRILPRMFHRILPSLTYSLSVREASRLGGRRAGMRNHSLPWLCLLGWAAWCAPGCQAPAIQSRLAGLWIMDAPASEGNAPAHTLTIRRDGTLDFGSSTAADRAMSLLRRVGDRSVGGPVGRERNEVVWCEYTPDASGILIRSTWPIDSQTASSLTLSRVLLNEDGTASYWVSCVPTRNIPACEVQRYTLRRSSARATAEIKMAVKEAPVATTLGDGGKAEFCLVSPERAEGVVLIVCVGLSNAPTECETHIRRWKGLVAGRELAVMIPQLDTVPWLIRAPDEHELGQVADRLRTCIAQVRSLIPVRDVCLLSESVGGLVCHALWQTGNSDFSAYLAWDSHFVKGTLGEHTSRTKPLHIWAKRNGLARLREQATAAADWYSAHGFTDVRFQQVDEIDPKAVDRAIVSVLLDRSADD